MKLIGIISTAVLSLTIAAPAYAQQEQHDQQEEQKAKPAQDEKKAQPEKPAKQTEKSQQDKNAKPEENRAQQQDKNAKPEENRAQQQDRNAKPEENRAQQQDKNAKPEERNAQRQQQAEPARQEQRGDGNRGGRIPDDRYQANFGREHTFRVTQGDYSNHRFQYGGYSFGFVDAWPSNWLYTEDLYVIDINGVYYLCNPMYPGVNIALSVTL